MAEAVARWIMRMILRWLDWWEARLRAKLEAAGCTLPELPDVRKAEREAVNSGSNSTHREEN